MMHKKKGEKIFSHTNLIKIKLKKKEPREEKKIGNKVFERVSNCFDVLYATKKMKIK